jgi:hypothetical protein
VVSSWTEFSLKKLVTSRLVLPVTVTGWYHTRRLMYCDQFWSIVLPHLSSNHSWFIHYRSLANTACVSRAALCHPCYMHILHPPRVLRVLSISSSSIGLNNISWRIHNKPNKLLILSFFYQPVAPCPLVLTILTPWNIFGDRPLTLTNEGLCFSQLPSRWVS